ncbi:MAG: folate-binding protein YgfZ [Alphaproteobacteria bacterium]|nr:folate-binding protein YgfZ [Alphaproteobacteria bacterium]
MTQMAVLPERGVVEIGGEDRVSFLQGLVSNDVAEAAPGRAVWAALLTPQGKWLADFFILSEGERLLLDCERAQAAMLAQRLGRFRLRAKVQVRDASAEFSVHAAWNGAPDMGAGIAAPDPRLPEAGWRILAREKLPANATLADWDRHRLALGLPDGSRDLEAEKSTLLEGGFDELNGVSWTKGCYMGQELTARTKYRGLLKRRLVPVEVDGMLPEPGATITKGSAEVGVMRSGRDRRGLALLRLDALDDTLTCAGATLSPRVPRWFARETVPAS